MSALEQAVVGPAIEVVAKATRRRFTVEYKRKIVREADACKPRFVDHAPAEVYATLLDAGQYVCSERTIIASWPSTRRCGSGAISSATRLCRPGAAGPSPQPVVEWDITKLSGPAKWTYFYLYVMLDVFSRYVVGWMVAHRESATLAQTFIRETCARQGIDRGSSPSRRSRPSMVQIGGALLADLGVTKTHGRPHVCNDNPFSEAQFKTLKYRRTSRRGSARSRMSAPTATFSSPGTTSPIITAAWACSPLTTCTSAWPSSAWPPGRPCSPRHMPSTQNASRAASPGRGRAPRPCGSTPRNPHQRPRRPRARGNSRRCP